jgi:hypothetical protein
MTFTTRRPSTFVLVAQFHHSLSTLAAGGPLASDGSIKRLFGNAVYLDGNGPVQCRVKR